MSSTPSVSKDALNATEQTGQSLEAELRLLGKELRKLSVLLLDDELEDRFVERLCGSSQGSGRSKQGTGSVGLHGHESNEAGRPA